MEQEPIPNAHKEWKYTSKKLRPVISIFLLIVVLLYGCHNAESGNSVINGNIKVKNVGTEVIYNVSYRDTNQYKECLLSLKKLVLEHANIPAKVLKDAAPLTDEEYCICYRLTEEEWLIELENS